MRKSYIFLMIAAWFGLATYIVLNKISEETREEQSTGLNQKIQAMGQKLQVQDERIEKLQAKIVEIEKLLAAQQQAPPSKPSNDERIEKLQAKILDEIEKLLAT